MMNNQSKKVTFEPTLLIYDGNEVSAQERRNQQLHQQQQQYSAFNGDCSLQQQKVDSPYRNSYFINRAHLANDMYSGVQDIIFMNNQHEILDNQIMNLDKDNGSNYSNGNNQYFPQQNINYAAAAQAQGNYGKKNAQNNNGDRFNPQSGKAKQLAIKQSKSLNDMNALINNNPLLQQSNSFQYQQQNNNMQNQQAPANPTVVRNDSAEGLSKLQSNPNIQISSIKSNVKNTYIKKISSLMNVQSNGDLQNAGNEKSGNIKMEIRESDDDGDDLSSKSYDHKGDDSNENKRLKKNRESARNSRQRKKIYIDLLEKKVTELTKEIEEVCVYIEKSQSGISSILSHNPYLRGLVQERLNFIEKIQKQITDPKPNEDELNLVADSFRLRLGATGRIRQHAIKLFYKHMYKSFLENNYEYFLYGYESNQDDDEEFNRCVEIFKDTIGLPENDNQIYSALPILKKFLEHRKSFKKIFREMKNIQKEWVTKTTSVENLVDKISPLLTATQVGKLIDFIDKKRQQPELNSMKRKYNQITSQQMANSFSGQFNAGNNQNSFSINYSQNLNQQLMTPSQILSANNALGNTFQQYSNQNGNNANLTIKNTFNNNVEFGGSDNGLGSLTEDPAQNFYSQIQFQNYRMYQPVFQIQQPPYFQGSMQNANAAAQSQNNINSMSGNDLQHNPNNHHHPSFNQPQNQHIQNHQIPQSIMHDGMFTNQHNPNQQGLPFFDMIPPQQKDDRDIIKQPIGSMIQNTNDPYFISDATQKKRKQY